MANETGSTWGQQGLSRRQVLRYSGVAAAGVAGAGSLAGCGGGSGDGGSSGPQKTGGTLTHGATGGSSKDSLDAHNVVTNPDIARVLQPLRTPADLGQRLPDRPGARGVGGVLQRRPDLDGEAAPGRHLPQRQARHGGRRAVHAAARRQPEGADLRGCRAGADPRLRRHQEVRRQHSGDQAQVALRPARQPPRRVHAGHRPGGLRPEEPGRHRPRSSTSRSRPARTASSSGTTTTGATRRSSTSCTSRTSPTRAPRSTRSRPARCRRSTTCPTT